MTQTTKYNTAILTEKTVKALRGIAVEMEIPGMSKQRKDIIVASIMKKQKSNAAKARRLAKKAGTTESAKKTSSAAPKKATRKVVTPGALNHVNFNMDSRITKPQAIKGDKATSTLTVSAGASSGNYEVVGQTVEQVAGLLREVLNVPRLAEGVVNGKVVDDSYVLCDGDTLDFVKPAGEKG